MLSNILIITIAISCFLGFWMLVCTIISLFGWSDLAKRYRAHSPATGTRYSGQSVVIGRSGNYRGCVTFHIAKEGLHLAVFPVFRAGHPPLFFPWSAVRMLRERQSMFGQRFLYDLGAPRVRRITIDPEMHRAIQHQQSGAGV